MNLPMPPTDNLYKFVALSGTVIVILTIYLLAEYNTKLNDKLEIFEMTISKLESESKYAIDKFKQIEKIEANTIANQNNKLKVDKNKVTIKYTDSEMKEMRKEADELAKSIGIKHAEVEQNYKKLNKATNISGRYTFYAFIFIAIGSILACIGYSLWYLRIQKYQDIVIKNEAFKE